MSFSHIDSCLYPAASYPHDEDVGCYGIEEELAEDEECREIHETAKFVAIRFGQDLSQNRLISLLFIYINLYSFSFSD